MKPRVVSALLLLTLLGACSTMIQTPPAKDENHYLSRHLLTDPWLNKFIERNHRKPVIEMIDVRDNYPKTYLYDPFQVQIIKNIPEGVVEVLLRSGKVKLVTTRIRSYTHLERYFEMRHARADTIKEPGHLTGADYVLVYRHSAIPPERVMDRPNHLVGTVSVHLELVSIIDDEMVWEGSENISIDTIQGITIVATVSNPGSSEKILRFNGKEYVDAGTVK